MLQYEELILEFENLKPQLTDLRAAINIDGLKKDIAELEEKTAQPDFWNDPESSQKISQKLGALKAKLAQYDKLAESFDDVITMAELANEEDDESMLPEIKELADKYNMKLDRIDVMDELDIKIKTDGRFIVEFGTSNSLENKFAHLEGMIKNIDKSKTGTVNLSMWSASNTEGSFVEGAVE